MSDNWIVHIDFSQIPRLFCAYGRSPSVWRTNNINIIFRRMKNESIWISVGCICCPNRVNADTNSLWKDNIVKLLVVTGHEDVVLPNPIRVLPSANYQKFILFLFKNVHFNCYWVEIHSSCIHRLSFSFKLYQGEEKVLIRDSNEDLSSVVSSYKCGTVVS